MSPSSLYRSFGLLCLASLILWWHTLITTLELALRDDEYSHILLVLPISVVLIFVEWRLHKPQPEPNFRAGLALLVIAVVIGSIGGWLCGRGGLAVDLRLTLGMLTVVTWWIGSFVYCFGTSISRICLFPLCFLLWVVPLPAFALHHIVSFLQQGSAYAARLLFTMARVPVAQDGVRLSVPGLTVEIAAECSSIRSSLILLITSVVVCHLLLRSAWSKVFIIFAAIVLCIAKNGLRIFILSMLAIDVDPGFLHGWLHHHGGIVFFLLTSAILFVLLRLVGWVERRQNLQASVTQLVNSIAMSKANAGNVL